jgi:hypothetical protein
MRLASVHVAPVTAIIGTTIYLLVLVGPTPPARRGDFSRPRGVLNAFVYMGTGFGVASGGLYFALTGSVKAAVIGGAVSGVLFGLGMVLLLGLFALVIRHFRPELWKFGRAWSDCGFSSTKSWWGFRRFRYIRRQARISAALRKEWLSEALPRRSAQAFLDSQKPSIEDRLHG